MFADRILALRAALAARPEPVLALVAHWGVFWGLTGTDFGNGELRVMTLAEIMKNERPFVTL